MSATSRLDLVRALLKLAQFGGTFLGSSVYDRFVEFLLVNTDVLVDLIPWLFSDSGQQPMLSHDSSLFRKANQKGVDLTGVEDFLASLQSAVRRAEEEGVDAGRVMEVTRQKESLTRTLVNDDGELVDEVPEQMNLGSGTLAGLMPLILELLRTLRPAKAEFRKDEQEFRKDESSS